VPLSGRMPISAVPPSAIAGTVTATNTTASDYVQVIPTGATPPLGATSSININGDRTPLPHLERILVTDKH
jgi:hypothetical protein